MATKTVDIAEAQTRLPDLVSLVNAGVEVVLTKNSTPVACLVPMKSSAATRVPGLHADAICVFEDFDEPLPDEFWTNAKKAGRLADWLGCLEHLRVTVSEEDIAAARREMWAGFPREFPQ